MMIMIASAIVLGGQWAGTYAWTEESGPAPQRRSSGQGVLLPDGRVWFGFGNHAGGAMRDWVVWDPDAGE